MSQVLLVDGVPVPTESIFEFDQQTEKLAARDIRRLADSTLRIRETWSGPLALVMRGKGWAPTGLEALDTGSTHTISCIQRRQVRGASTTITLPAARRVDAEHDPVGYAIVNGELVETTITNLAAINAKSTNDATLTVVGGASGYAVDYWPELVVAITRNTAKADNANTFEWTIEGEEV